MISPSLLRCALPEMAGLVVMHDPVTTKNNYNIYFRDVRVRISPFDI